jgi:hypothetical protein
MDRDGALAALTRNLTAADADDAHAVYHPDAVLEFPQSGERFEGVQNFKPWRAAYPTKVDYEVDRMRGGDDVWVGEVRVRYGGGPWRYGVTILEFRGDKVARETIYVNEGWAAPEWRASWRASGHPGPHIV